MNEESVKNLRDFEIYLTQLIGKEVQHRVSEENVPVVAVSLANVLVAFCWHKFGPQYAPEVISTAVNRALEIFRVMEGQSKGNENDNERRNTG